MLTVVISTIIRVVVYSVDPNALQNDADELAFWIFFSLLWLMLVIGIVFLWYMTRLEVWVHFEKKAQDVVAGYQVVTESIAAPADTNAEIFQTTVCLGMTRGNVPGNAAGTFVFC